VQWQNVLNPATNKAPFSEWEQAVIVLVRVPAALAGSPNAGGRSSCSSRQQQQQPPPSPGLPPQMRDTVLRLPLPAFPKPLPPGGAPPPPVQAQPHYNNQWSQISSLLPGRTPYAVKNHCEPRAAGLPGWLGL
jgi:hypothetical protein